MRKYLGLIILLSFNVSGKSTAVSSRHNYTFMPRWQNYLPKM